MTVHFFAMLTLLSPASMWTNRILAFTLITLPFSAQAAPTGFGTFKISTQNAAAGTATGDYTASGSGAKGTFTIERKELNGYSGTSFTAGSNGFMIFNEVNQGSLANDEDKFTYTITLTPADNSAIHTIKISQATYATSGNSEIARQTLSYTQNPTIRSIATQATVRDNPKVPYFYDAMGDYFMGSRVDSRRLNSQLDVSEPQLRFDSSNGGESGLYYYNIPKLTGATGNQNPYTPTLTRNNQVTLNSNNGVLPPTPTFANIIKSINNGSSYLALPSNSTIASGGSYVSYGVENTQSNYVVAIKNPKTVTLTYEGIMNGNIGVSAPVVGETFNEWITFGVESEPLYVFSGKVFNDDGGVGNANPQDTSLVNNLNYFNGKLDSNELGISESNLQVRLTDCKGNNIVTIDATPNPQTVNSTNQDKGKYSFSVLPSTLRDNKTGVCIVEQEPLPSSWSYTVDTTPNELNTSFTTSTYKYTDLNFGEVTQNNSALALQKYQFVHDCDPNLSYINISSNTSSPLTGFSTKNINNITPGKCIAYKIEAHNRGHLSLADIQIMDSLQKKTADQFKVESVFQLPRPEGIPAKLYKTDKLDSGQANIGENGTIISDKFNLPTSTSNTSTTVQALFFNTKYGTSQSNTANTP